MVQICLISSAVWYGFGRRLQNRTDDRQITGDYALLGRDLWIPPLKDVPSKQKLTWMSADRTGAQHYESPAHGVSDAACGAIVGACALSCRVFAHRVVRWFGCIDCIGVSGVRGPDAKVSYVLDLEETGGV